MSNQQFKVIDNMIDKGQRWKASLTPEDIGGIRLVAGHDSSSALGVIEFLLDQFPDNRTMVRVVVESMARCGSFDEMIADVRLNSGEAPFIDAHALEQAQARFNAAIAERLGIILPEVGRDAPPQPGEILAHRAADWVEGLSDAQVAEAAQVTGIPVFPQDVVGLLEPYFDFPEILKDMVKQGVEEMRPFASFMANLRQFGELDHLDTGTALRIRKCYHALVASGLEVDMVAELARREAIRVQHTTDEGIIEVISKRFSEPGDIGAILKASLVEGRTPAGFLVALRERGALEHLSGAEFARIRQDYDALSLQASRGQSPLVGHGEAIEMTPAPDPAPASELPDVPDAVVGAWTQKVASARGSAGVESTQSQPAPNQ